MNPIPHITARTITDEDALARVVEKYANRISEVLIIAGSKDQAAGPSQVLQTSSALVYLNTLVSLTSE